MTSLQKFLAFLVPSLSNSHMKFLSILRQYLRAKVSYQIKLSQKYDRFSFNSISSLTDIEKHLLCLFLGNFELLKLNYKRFLGSLVPIDFLQLNPFLLRHLFHLLRDHHVF